MYRCNPGFSRDVFYGAFSWKICWLLQNVNDGIPDVRNTNDIPFGLNRWSLQTFLAHPPSDTRIYAFFRRATVNQDSVFSSLFEERGLSRREAVVRPHIYSFISTTPSRSPYLRLISQSLHGRGEEIVTSLSRMGPYPCSFVYPNQFEMNQAVV